MAEPKWTPGPWRIEGKIEDGEVSIVNRDAPDEVPRDICTAHSGEANARLIAAVPEMDDALGEADECLSELVQGRPESYANAVLFNIRKVRAKARGETT